MERAEEVLDELFARWAVRTRAPGISWGLIRDGALVASGGAGMLRVGEPAATPDADSVFRVASMTKSFTGAALMTLVAEGRMRLDDPVAAHVPALAHWRGPTSDAPPLTVRHLVSMEAGLPNDDPWADRHLDISPEEMDALIATGAEFAWPPGIAFEYSNLAWGLVGRVIDAVAGVTAQELVSERLLDPLDMRATTWTRPPAPAAVAEPHRWQDGAWVAEPEPLGDGGIAPMGGLWTTVRDLARWIGFFQDAWPPRGDPDEGPLPRWARREMQQPRRLDAIGRTRPRPDGPSRVSAYGYGIGLGARVDERLGMVVGHSGGLPGYGSHMRWIPDRGVGVVALSNVTYGNMHAACIEALEVLADLDELGPRRVAQPSARLRDASERVAALLSDWDDGVAEALFTDNVGQDEPLERRAAEARAVAGRHGALTVESLVADTPLRGTFTAAGGLVKVELWLHHAGQVQFVEVTDRSQPAEDPIVTDPALLARLAGGAAVVLRPTADLADAFARWQGEALDRLNGVHATVPAAHVTLKSFGSSDAPLTRDHEAAIAEVVAAWAAATPPIELRADALDVFDGDERIPIVRLAPIAARADLSARAAEAGLPGSESDRFGVNGWIAHLTLCHPLDPDPGAWAGLVTWARHADTGGRASIAHEAELLVFDGGPERRLGRFPLTG